MYTKPLTYQSLKCVIEYMDINMRVQLARRCPSIRQAEKKTPVRVQELHMCKKCIMLNGTCYTLGIYRKYHDGNPPKSIQEINDNGGVWHDLDEFGFKDPAGENIITPGDIDLRDPQQPRWEEAPADQATIERAIQRCEYEIERRRKGGAIVRNRPWPESLNDEDLMGALEESKAQLLPFIYRRDQISPPYDAYIKLTICRREWETKIEYYQYNKKYHEAMKQLVAVFFGGRPSPINVHSFPIENRHTVLRLPLGVKFKVFNLKLSGNFETAYNALLPVLEPSTFPLGVLRISISPRHQIFSHQIVQEAKLLILGGCSLNVSFLSVLLNLKNERVHVENELTNFVRRQDFVSLVEDWIGNGRPVKTHFTFRFYQQTSITDLIGVFKANLNGIEKEDGSIVIPMSATSELHISCISAFNPEDSDRDRLRWMLQLIVKESK